MSDIFYSADGLVHNSNLIEHMANEEYYLDGSIKVAGSVISNKFVNEAGEPIGLPKNVDIKGSLKVKDETELGNTLINNNLKVYGFINGTILSVNAIRLGNLTLVNQDNNLRIMNNDSYVDIGATNDSANINTNRPRISLNKDLVDSRNNNSEYIRYTADGGIKIQDFNFSPKNEDLIIKSSKTNNLGMTIHRDGTVSLINRLQPASQTPVAQTPVAQTPVAQTPVAQTPVAKTPAAETPVAKTPVAQTPVAQTPVAQKPVAPTPVAPIPVVPTTSKTWYVNWTPKTGVLNFKVGNDIALHFNIRNTESVMFIWRNNKWENGTAVNLPLHNYPRPLQFTVTFDKEFIINIGSNVIKYPNFLSLPNANNIVVNADVGIVVTTTKPEKLTFNRLNNTNCGYGRLTNGPRSNGNDYKYIGEFNSYDECINSPNIDPKTKAIAYHNNFSGVWSKTCYGIFDSNTKVADNNSTCGVRQ